MHPQLRSLDPDRRFVIAVEFVSDLANRIAREHQRRAPRYCALDVGLLSLTPCGTCPEGCGVRIGGATRACVITVRIGRHRKFKTIGTVTADSPYVLRERAARELASLPRSLADESTLKQALVDYGHAIRT